MLHLIFSGLYELNEHAYDKNKFCEMLQHMRLNNLCVTKVSINHRFSSLPIKLKAKIKHILLKVVDWLD